MSKIQQKPEPRSEAKIYKKTFGYSFQTQKIINRLLTKNVLVIMLFLNVMTRMFFVYF